MTEHLNIKKVSRVILLDTVEKGKEGRDEPEQEERGGKGKNGEGRGREGGQKDKGKGREVGRKEEGGMKTGSPPFVSLPINTLPDWLL